AVGLLLAAFPGPSDPLRTRKIPSRLPPAPPMDPKKCSALIIIILMIRGLAFAQAPMPRPLVRINTTMGTMIVALYNETPAHRDRFLGSVREHLYDSTLVHRVVPGLMLQGGDL